MFFENYNCCISTAYEQGLKIAASLTIPVTCDVADQVEGGRRRVMMLYALLAGLSLHT